MLRFFNECINSLLLVSGSESPISHKMKTQQKSLIGDYVTNAGFPLLTVAEADPFHKRRSEATLAELGDGSLFLAYASHVGESDNARAKIVSVLLNPDGIPLTDERDLVEPPPGGLNAMSPAAKRLPDGRLGLLFSYRHSKREASRRFMVSSDDGQSWSAPTIVATGGYKTGCHDRFVIHSSGRLLAPLHCTEDWDQHHLHVRVARSDDHGKTWELSGPVELPIVRWPAGSDGSDNTESGCIEPGIAEREDGSLLMTLRTAMGTQFGCESFDAGRTWSAPRSMEIISPVAPAHISRIPNTSDLLMLWTSDYDAKAPLSGERHTLMSCVSRDGGRSWPHANRKILVQDFSRSIDYPSVLYRGAEAIITLRVSSGSGILEGLTSTCLTRVPLHWFYAS